MGYNIFKHRKKLRSNGWTSLLSTQNLCYTSITNNDPHKYTYFHYKITHLLLVFNKQLGILIKPLYVVQEHVIMGYRKWAHTCISNPLAHSLYTGFPHGSLWVLGWLHMGYTHSTCAHSLVVSSLSCSLSLFHHIYHLLHSSSYLHSTLINSNPISVKQSNT